ncbi:MAG: GYD domain-containing protein [Thermoleophilia bacterium]|nr:GYD domain-containing protein [Thermoleophilia bacterium]
MRTFLLLSSLSPQGLQTLAATPERLFEVNREIERLGGRVVKQWALLGAYDFLSVVEAPEALTITKLTIELSSRGSASFEVLAAIPVDELIASLGPPEPDSG